MKKLHFKLIQMLLITSLLPVVVVACISIVFLDRIAVTESSHRIENSLDISMGIYQKTLDELKYTVRDLNRRVFTLMEEDQLDLLRNEFVKVVKKNDFDFFIITDSGGRVIVSMCDPGLEGIDLGPDRFVSRALRNQVSVSTEVLSEKELKALGLFEKAGLSGISETEGMVIRASLPVINKNEIIVGTMSAGYLLNNRDKIIICEIASSTDMISTIFMKDRRICSNVPVRKGETVLGSTLNPEISKTILEEGKRYYGRMQVADNWYLAGYSPIYNSAKKIIGILGIGVSEKEVFNLRNKLIKIFTLAVLLAIILSMVFGILKGEKIVKSIDKLRKGIAAFAQGDYDHRISINSRDEIEELADFFNHTMAQLKATRQQLDVCARNVLTLQSRVSQSNAELEEAHKQLLSYERMAAMGRMAAALSHELRNVFAEIQTAAYNLKNKAGKDFPQLAGPLKGIDDALTHANSLLTDILKFSHPKQLVLSEVDINYLIEDLLSSADLKDQFRNHNIRIIKDLGPDIPKLNIDGIQMREVVSNLVTNAIHAMPGGGKINIVTQNDQGLIRIKVTDTGLGMSQETLDNLFTPFFTTKNRGLGLGLCISKAIVESHGGHIQVHSGLNEGTTFIVSLPAKKS
jgi:two-component system NtrC family sensor kinase